MIVCVQLSTMSDCIVCYTVVIPCEEVCYSVVFCTLVGVVVLVLCGLSC